MDDLMERKSEDLDRLTEAFAAGYAIAMSDKARAAWQARHIAPSAGDPEAASRQSATIARLARLFPGAVKAKAN